MELFSRERVNAYPYVLFQIKDSFFVISCEYVSDMQPAPDNISHSPKAPNHICGVFNSFGRIITILDLAMLLGLRDMLENIKDKSVIILQGKPFKGLLVDKIISVLSSETMQPIGCSCLTNKLIENIYESKEFKDIFMKINVKMLLATFEHPNGKV